MCGIVGVIGARAAVPLLLEGLRRLEYRGYDSAGVATLVNGQIERRRAEGKLVNLAAALDRAPVDGTTGIGHTRWATHGAPTETNAHPHGTARVAVVHNGIIENHADLRAELEAAGQMFETETDTEAVAQLLDLYLKQGMAPEEAAAAAFGRLEGAYALALVFAGHPELIIGARHGAPLAVGFGAEEMYLGSDALALAPLTQRIAYLEDGDWAVLSRTGARFFDAGGAEVQRAIKLTAYSGAAIGKGNYRHFMEKELHEHPAVIGDSLHRMVSPATRAVALPALPFDFAAVPRVAMSACGSAFYAGLVGRYWFETVARLPVDADVASEFRYRAPPLPKGGLGLLVSQSGETADTLAALRFMREAGQKVLSIVNVAESSIARESDAIMQTVAGPEIGVASTKAFCGQIVVETLLALSIARRKYMSQTVLDQFLAALEKIPGQMRRVLDQSDQIREVTTQYCHRENWLFLGRGFNYPVALEGALKLKEISYIHAEGLPAAEMKHGPIALINPGMPVVFIATRGTQYEKLLGNIQEVKARSGRVIAVASEGDEHIRSVADHVFTVPDTIEPLQPLLTVLPLQLLAYHAAVARGCNVDKPRNLAKSVTVE